MKTLITNITGQLQSIHFGHNWFGQSYKVKLQDLAKEHRFKHPHPNIHAVAELLAHGTAWRRDAILKIQTGKGELTEASEDDWQDLEKLKEKGWETIISEYQSSVASLLEILKLKNDDFLESHYHDPEFAGDFPYSFAIYGILQHDIYHLGQIGLVIKMLSEMNDGN